MGNLVCKYHNRPGTYDPIVKRVLCYNCRKVLCESRELIRLVAVNAIEESLGQSV